jgi:septal ring factor EnvC (AmiA/AmiB activator)
MGGKLQVRLCGNGQRAEKTLAYLTRFLYIDVATICQLLAEPLMLKTTLTLITLFTLGFIATGQAQQRENLDVRLARIEESIKATNQHIEELAKGINQRLDDMNKGINQRIDDMNQRIDDTNQRLEAGFDRQTNMLITVMGFVAAGFGVIVWFARQERPVSKKHYDKLQKQDEELGKNLRSLPEKMRAETVVWLNMSVT